MSGSHAPWSRRLWPVSAGGAVLAPAAATGIWFAHAAGRLERPTAAGLLVLALLLADVSVSHLWWRFGGAMRAWAERMEARLTARLGRVPRSFWAGTTIGAALVAAAAALLPVRMVMASLELDRSARITCRNDAKEERRDFLVYLPVPFESWARAGSAQRDGRDLRLFAPNARGVPWNLVPLASGSSASLRWHLVFPVTIPAGAEATYRLFFGAGTAAIAPPERPGGFAETPLADMSGSSGMQIARWERREIPAAAGPWALDDARSLLAPFGDSVIAVIVEPEPVPGDHATNQSITFQELYQELVREDTVLEYDIQAAQAGPMRASVQGRAGDRFLWDNPAKDALGLPAAWPTDLDSVYVGRWYHRTVPLGAFADDYLSDIFLMTNDEPDLTSFAPLRFFFDNVRVYAGPPPACALVED
ncbi:MAG: hypothetical protein HYV63_25100 [Candidatus Schekmanbacteria bacterium]|nr:hypothetical protein [Candidatus Schekmanbacteria bacterium]